MISYDRAHELFRYDPETGDLFWRVSSGPRAVVGSKAGSLDSGYFRVGVDGESILVPRIIFLMHHGWVPEKIDHKNRIRSHNKVKNLRPANDSQNCGNIGLQKNNTSGFRGVTRYRSRWVARIHMNDERVHLGVFDTPEEAARAYDSIARIHFGEFAWLNFKQGELSNEGSH